jgi:DNA-binding response OmpR family regulator
MTVPTVALVNPTDEFRKQVRMWIEQSDLDLDLVEGGEDVGSRAPDEHHSPDLVVMDVTLPGKPGEKVLAALRAAAPDVPILVMVMEAKAPPARVGETAVRLLEAGATDYCVVDPGMRQLQAALFRHKVRLLLRNKYQRAGGQAAPSRADTTQRERPGISSRVAPVRELHNERSGRLDAQRIADFLDVPLAKLADAVELNYKALHRTPDAPAAQQKLRPVALIIGLLVTALEDTTVVRSWLNSPREELEGDSPLAVILAGEADAVLTLLEGARVGLPG